tara:strand:- start:9 stop:230 length:222 start_codon:yes stop_codon:yes gene_type:complete
MESDSPEWKIFKVFLTIMFVMFLNYIIPMIFNFINIGPEIYQIYLYWLIAIVIMYLILPVAVGENLFRSIPAS